MHAAPPLQPYPLQAAEATLATAQLELKQASSNWEDVSAPA